MSLINEALKKAQRLRAEQQGNYTAPPMPGGTSPVRIVKRGQAMPAKTLLLILAAATVLIVLSAVFTGYFMNRAPSHVPGPKVTKPALAPNLTGTNPVIVAPAITLPKPAIEPTQLASAPTADNTHENSQPQVSPPVDNSSAPAVAILSPPLPDKSAKPTDVTVAPNQNSAGVIQPREITPPAPATTAASKFDSRIQVFVDSVRVAGIRFSGKESKVLMNDRVYRVNDVVDYALNVRLLRVTPDSLIFVDANGMIYVKNF